MDLLSCTNKRRDCTIEQPRGDPDHLQLNVHAIKYAAHLVIVRTNTYLHRWRRSVGDA